MCKLTGWYLGYQFFNGKRCVVAKGIVYDHPNLKDGHKIHTSEIKWINIENEVAKIKTRNNIYECQMNDARYEKFVDISSYKFAFGEVLDEIRRCEEKYGRKEVEIRDGQAVIVLGDNREYYFDSFSIDYKGHKETKDEPTVHVGTFQDSVLNRFWINEEHIQFDYFPYKGNQVEFYHWDDSGMDVYVENCGIKDMIVEVSYNYYRIEPGQRKLIDEKNMELVRPENKKVDLYNIWEDRE